MKSSIKSDFSEVRIQKGTIVDSNTLNLKSSELRGTELPNVAKSIAYEKNMESARLNSENNN